MIRYKLDKFQLRFLWQIQGSVFPKACVVALPCAISALFLKVFAIAESNLTSAPSGYVGFTFVVGFLLVFRSSQAYSRVWEGSTLVHQMRAEWLDACSQIFSFNGIATMPEKEVEYFQQLLIRLFSLLHASALEKIADMEDEDYEVIDVGGLDHDSIVYLSECDKKGVCKAEVVFYWINLLIVQNLHNGMLPIPAPIVSRVFQELSSGMVRFHECVKVLDTPFPFPYAQMTVALLIVHWIMTPFIASMYSDDSIWAAGIAFISVFCMWSINFIAGELEQPFGDDANDLPTREIQEEMNHSLLNLMSAKMNSVPKLSSYAVFNPESLGQAHKRNSLQHVIQLHAFKSKKSKSSKTQTFEDALQHPWSPRQGTGRQGRRSRDKERRRNRDGESDCQRSGSSLSRSQSPSSKPAAFQAQNSGASSLPSPSSDTTTQHNGTRHPMTQPHNSFGMPSSPMSAPLPGDDIPSPRPESLESYSPRRSSLGSEGSARYSLASSVKEFGHTHTDPIDDPFEVIIDGELPRTNSSGSEAISLEILKPDQPASVSQPFHKRENGSEPMSLEISKAGKWDSQYTDIPSLTQSRQDTHPVSNVAERIIEDKLQTQSNTGPVSSSLTKL